MKMLILAMIFISPAIYAGEADYQRAHCKGITEFVLFDKTRVDCLTDTHAIEYDFGKKWAEAVGQSLHYAMHTGRRAGIVLIIDHDEYRFLQRATFVINHYNLPIDIWSIQK